MRFLLLISALCFVHLPAASQAQAPMESMTFDESLFEGLNFRMIGPSRGGRVTAVAGHASQPNTFYMGSTGGGVWKTQDNGQSWISKSDGFFETGSIGSIDVADSDPDIIYVGTGSDGIRSNVIIGRGIYKSMDGGETWKHLGLRNTGQIGAVVVHPSNPEVVYVAALGSPFGANPERGVYKTIDGGETWEQILYLSDRVGAVDLELNPVDPEMVYAAMWLAERKPWTIISGGGDENGIYRSSNGGRDWTKMDKGLPEGLIGKIDFAVSPADPSRVYALVETRPEEEGLYRSNDRGETWRLVNNEPGLMERPFYYTNVDADPTDADVVYVNNRRYHKSINGGRDFKIYPTPHGDNHDMWINPDNPDHYIQANDGGANVTLDGGKTWSTQHNQPTAELYQVNVDDRFPYWLYAGQQDNSTIAVPSLPPTGKPGGAPAYWEAIGGCETGPVVPKPGDPNIVYTNCKGLFGRYSRLTGRDQQYVVGAVSLYGVNPSVLPYRFQRVVPIEVSPHNPDVIYHGSQFVHKTTDEGKTWEQLSPDLTAFRAERQVFSGSPITRDITGEEHYSTLYVIEESPLQEGLIWTGANDGPVHVSTDGGATWTDVTPPDMPPEGRIQSIEPSPHNPNKAYIAGYRYLLNDFHPYIYRTDDAGQTWTLLTDGSNGIPEDYPTRVVREDPAREGLLYAGTEFGLFVSFDDGASWQSFQRNLPATPITDMKVVRNDLVMSTMGRSFWMLDNLTPLHALNAGIQQAGVHLFKPRDAYRMRYFSGQRQSTDPEYIQPGVMIDYHIANAAQRVTVEIKDDAGQTLRTFSSDKQEMPEVPEQGMRQPPVIEPVSSLSTTKGMHRFIWDMRHLGAIDEDGDRMPGPLALPGQYNVTLIVDGERMSEPFSLLIDPRVAEDGVTQDDLVKQLDFGLQAQDLITRTWQLVAQIDSTKKILEANPSSASTIESLDAIRAALVTEEGDSYPEPRFDRQASYLTFLLRRADQRPGKDAFDRLAELQTMLEGHENDFKALMSEVSE